MFSSIRLWATQLSFALITSRGDSVGLQIPLESTSQSFGVGFDFTPSYATAAVSFPNGSKILLARIEGDAAWCNLMAQLSWDGHIDLRNDATASTASQLQTLSTMVLALKTASEHHLGDSVTTAVASLPSRNIVSRWGTPVADLVAAAFSEAGLEFLRIVVGSAFGEPLVYPENAIQAAHGLGVCQSYTVPEKCKKEKTVLPGETYYFVGYYNNELEVTTTSITFWATGVVPSPWLSYRLGSSMRNENPNESFYWEEVRQLLSKPFIKRPSWKPSKLILYGDQSGDETMRNTIREVLGSFLDQKDMPDWIDNGVDPIFAGAMGAAEFAKRYPYQRLLVEGINEPKTDL